jgi:3'-phosphoadenosine 5'-phosphosulfate sulfotransferase (PAPS reductase)/FAD synthetase
MSLKTWRPKAQDRQNEFNNSNSTGGGLHKDNFIDPLTRQLKTFYDRSFKVFTGTRDDFSHSRQNLPRKSHTAGNAHSIQVKPCPFQLTSWRSSAILNPKMGAPVNLLQHKQHFHHSAGGPTQIDKQTKTT